MIASVGARNLVESKIDFQKPRNMIIFAVVMVFGLGLGDIRLLNLSPLAFGAIVGIILNKLLPEKIES